MRVRKILFWLHLTTGCMAGTIVLIMSITGLLLAYERQIISWNDRDFRSASPGPGCVRAPFETALGGVVSQNRTMPSAITLRADPAAPVEVSFGREHVFLVDAYSGKVLGESGPRTRWFFQNVENWHRWLGAGDQNRDRGRAITGACNFGFLLLVVSGPFLWLPRSWSWRNVRAIALFRAGLSGRARDFNWHNAIGIWCALPLALIVLSGVIMSYPWANNLLYRLTGTEQAAQGAGQGAGRGSRSGEAPRRPETSEPNLAALNSIWRRAEQQVSGWRSITLRLAPSGRGPMTFTIDTGNGGRPDQRSQLTLDRRTGDVIRWEPFSSYNTGRRLRSWFRFLHTGEAGGVAGQTVAGVASAGAAMLAWTGLWLACRRLLQWKARAGRN